MKPVPRVPLLIAILPLLLSAAEAPRSCTVRELKEVLLATNITTEMLLATGTVQSVHDRAFSMSDSSGCVRLSNYTSPTPKPGTVVEVVCSRGEQSDHDKILRCYRWSALGTNAIAPPLNLNLNEIDDHLHDSITISIEGTVVDVVTPRGSGTGDRVSDDRATCRELRGDRAAKRNRRNGLTSVFICA